MRVLVTNDDGIDAPGIAALARAAVDLGHDVVVAAPAEQSSGAGASIIANRRDGDTPVRSATIPGLPDVAAYAVEAQPAHIVLAALRGWLDPVPDLVLSGINHGANVGRVVLHSGTVGAALTAGVHDVRALALSLDVALHADASTERHWAAATDLLPRVLDLLLAMAAGTVLSLNAPDRARPGELRAATLAPFGTVQTRVDSSDGDHWRLDEVESDEEADPGSDTALLAAGHATLTALSPVQEDPGSRLVDRLGEFTGTTASPGIPTRTEGTATHRHDPRATPDDRTDGDRTEASAEPHDEAPHDEARRLDRELAVANDIAPDGRSREAPGIAAGEAP